MTVTVTVQAGQLAVTFLELLLQPHHDARHLPVQLRQALLVSLGEDDDRADGGEDSSGKDSHRDQRVSGDQTSYQRGPKD